MSITRAWPATANDAERLFIMKLNIKAVVIAEAVVGAVLFILCRLAFVVAPDATLAALKYLTHIDWPPLTMPVTMTGAASSWG